MIRTALIAAALAISPIAASAQPGTDERDQGMAGVMSLEELRREPIEFELDVPYAATDNPRQRLVLLGEDAAISTEALYEPRDE